MNLSLRDALCFHQVAQEVGVRCSWDWMILILVHRNEITESIKIRLFATGEFLLVRETVEQGLGRVSGPGLSECLGSGAFGGFPIYRKRKSSTGGVTCRAR